MKTIATSSISGCIIWIIVIGILSACLLPITFAIGITTTESDLAIKTTAPYVCPKETSARINSYEGMTPDQDGFDTPATVYEMQCLDASGKVVYTDPIVWGFLWLGIWVGVGVLATLVLAFLLAAPAGVLVGRFLNGTKTRPA